MQYPYKLIQVYKSHNGQVEDVKIRVGNRWLKVSWIRMNLVHSRGNIANTLHRPWEMISIGWDTNRRPPK